jgi:U6 snRNA-associated Sm-like protein LSm8
MASTLNVLVDKCVSVITCDGRHIVGILKGFDQKTNIVLCDCHEREYPSDDGVGVQKVPLGAQIIQGSNVCIIGELDVAVDEQLDFDAMVGEPVGPVLH